jgi:hypothetical protein
MIKWRNKNFLLRPVRGLLMMAFILCKLAGLAAHKTLLSQIGSLINNPAKVAYTKAEHNNNNKFILRDRGAGIKLDH